MLLHIKKYCFIDFCSLFLKSRKAVSVSLRLSYDLTHCVKSVRIRRYSGPYIPVFVLNGKIRSIFLYSVRMQKNANQNNSEYRHFSRSDSDYFDIMFLQPNN